MLQTKSIVAVSVVAALVAVTIMALVTRIFMARANHTTTNNKYAAEDRTGQAHELAQISHSWKRVFTPKQDQAKSHWVPGLTTIIKAGDEGLFTSALFTNLNAHPGEPVLEALYDAFANELRAQPVAERSSYPGDMTRFLARTKRPTATLGRSKSVSHTKRTETIPKTHRKSLDLSVMEMGLTRGLSVKKPAAALVSMRNGLQDDGCHNASQPTRMKDGQNAKYQEGSMTVKVTPAELATLSILLGSQISVNDTSQEASTETGAYGISVIANNKPPQNVTFKQHELSISQRHASASGVSTLFAKHIFCGSLPYLQDNLGVHSILINNETFEAIQTGASLSTHPYVTRTPQSRYLESLPSSRVPRFHILATSTEGSASTTLLDAIAALPFSGGLAPLASGPLIRTVRFVASAGLSPARLLQRLEGLVDKVHRHSPHLNIFGPLYEPQHAGLLYRERERLGKLANDTSITDSLADKTARMSRYVTLLERLMAMVPGMKPQFILAAVQETTKLELARSYEQAVAAHTSPETLPDIDITPSDPFKSPTLRPSPRRSNRSSNASPAASSEFPTENLAKQLEHVLKSDLPLDVSTIAFVARMVFVAWTLSVHSVPWGEEEDEREFGVEELGSLDGGGKIVMS
jgi:hypothetical protein